MLHQTLFEQALINLVDNAIKYSEDDSEITVGVRNGGPDVIIDVKDNGPGISEEHLPRLFERFYSVDKARSRSLGGSGLGLSIVKHIVLAHSGRVSVESSRGEGARFSIVLPSVSHPN